MVMFLIIILQKKFVFDSDVFLSLFLKITVTCDTQLMTVDITTGILIGFCITAPRDCGVPLTLASVMPTKISIAGAGGATMLRMLNYIIL